MQFSTHNYGSQWESHALKAHRYTFLSELWVWLSIHNYTISLSCLSLVFLSHEFPCPCHVIVRYVQIPRLALSSVSIRSSWRPMSLCHAMTCHLVSAMSILPMSLSPMTSPVSVPCSSLTSHTPTFVSHAYTINQYRCRIPLHPW